MRRLIPVAIAMLISLGGVAAAQTATPVPTTPPEQTAPPVDVPTVPPVAPAQETDEPAEAPIAPVEEVDDADGLSDTAILLLILGGVALLLLIFAIAMNQRRRPGDPGPPN